MDLRYRRVRVPARSIIAGDGTPEFAASILEREPHALSAVLRILLRVIEVHLRRSSDASARACFEPVEEADDGPQSVRFRAAAELTPEAVATVTEPSHPTSST